MFAEHHFLTLQSCILKVIWKQMSVYLWKVSVSGVFLVHIFPYSDRIRTSKTLNADIFHSVVCFCFGICIFNFILQISTFLSLIQALSRFFHPILPIFCCFPGLIILFPLFVRLFVPFWTSIVSGFLQIIGLISSILS